MSMMACGLIVSIVLSVLVGCIHWILGVLFFIFVCIPCFWKFMLIDMAESALKYHHDRNDERARYEQHAADYRAYAQMQEDRKLAIYKESMENLNKLKEIKTKK